MLTSAINNIFQNTQNHGFWNFDVWFLSKGKKAAVNYFLYVEMKELVYPPPNIVRCYLNLFVTLRQHDSSVEKKMVNYWPEICKLLPRDRKNVALYTVTI